MACEPIIENGKVIGWFCTRTRQRIEPCYICGRPSTRLCDYDTPAGSCDRPMCSKHSHRSGKDTDYCEEHYQDLLGRQMTLMTDQMGKGAKP